MGEVEQVKEGLLGIAGSQEVGEWMGSKVTVEK